MSQSSLLLFANFDDKVGEAISLGNGSLVRRVGRDMDDIALSEFALHSALDCGAAGFTRASAGRIHDFSSSSQGCFPIYNKENIGVVFVQLRAATGGANGEHSEMPRIFFQSFAGRSGSAQALLLL